MMRNLLIGRRASDIMVEQCRAAYPEEACGMLIGIDAEPNDRRVVEARSMTNAAAAIERPHRFRLDPHEQIVAEREVESRGLAVVGFYHSHPDALAVPSATDAAEAWPFYSYVIVPVTSAHIGPMRSWAFDENAKAFVEEAIVELDI